MKLYLSSYLTGTSPEHLVKLLGSTKHAALILNASDVYGETNRASYVARFQEEFSALGISSEELDLRHYFGKTQALKSDLERFGLIWEGLGLFDFHIVPHYRSKHAESESTENVVTYLTQHRMPYYALFDGQAVVFESGNAAIVGEAFD